MNDESGVLIEGYELKPMIAQPWNPPYYRERLEQAGMTKAIDLLMWSLDVEDRDKVLPVMWELAGKVESEHGIRVRPMRRWQLRKDMDAFADVYNSAWSKNWDFVPYEEASTRSRRSCRSCSTSTGSCSPSGSTPARSSRWR